MTPVVISLNGANRQTSCKHLCCREGVDKAPKPPKHSTDSIALSKAETKNFKKAANSRFQNQPKLQVDKVAKFRKSVDIEKVDLSKSRDLDEYSKTAPGDYKKLHRLHKSVNKGPAAPIISTRQKPFSHEKIEERSGSPCAINYLKAPNRRSSDYDSAGIDEFPSPSAILCLDKKFAGTLSTTTSNQDSYVPAFEDDFSDVELEVLGKKQATAQDDHTRTGLAYAGLRDYANVMSHDIRDKGSTRSEQLPILPTAKSTFDEPSPFKSDGLFFSTSNPEKVAPSLEKRKSRYKQETETFDTRNESMAKRRKISKLVSEQVLQQSGRVLQPSTGGNDQDVTPAQAPGPILQKSGRPRPEWVDEFDPEFIAEYADVVEFI